MLSGTIGRMTSSRSSIMVLQFAELCDAAVEAGVYTVNEDFRRCFVRWDLGRLVYPSNLTAGSSWVLVCLSLERRRRSKKEKMWLSFNA
jgi:hypothetical protein